MQKFLFLILPFLLSAWLMSCGDNITEDVKVSSLEVKITIIDENLSAEINATAENAVNFSLIVNNNEDEVSESESGYFMQSFGSEGIYTLEIRAYGKDGRYIKETEQIEIGATDSDNGYTSPLNYEGYTLIWNDEFNSSSINTSDWNFEVGTGEWGWGNNELQYYRRDNAWISDGKLIIEAREEVYMGSSYTSARMTTNGNHAFKYGRIDIRAKLPEGQGLWPALWMLGQNFNTIAWPQCGEIDIMEMIGGSDRENTVHGTLHWDNNGHVSAGGNTTLDHSFADKYHVFTITWDAVEIKWFVDDTLFHTINITPEHMSEFHASQFFIFNVAVGGTFPGNPDETSVFPQQMAVDYVRVFQEN